MNTIRCPNCHTELTEAQIRVKPTKDKRYVKVRCFICHHAWKVPAADFHEQDPVPVAPGI